MNREHLAKAHLLTEFQVSIKTTGGIRQAVYDVYLMMT